MTKSLITNKTIYFLGLIIFLSVFYQPPITSGQAVHHDQFLRMEKINSAKTKRFYVGQEVRYKVDGNKWKKGVIEKLDFVQQMVFFSTGPARIKDIIGIQTLGQYGFSQVVKYKLITFGASVLFYSVFNPLNGMAYPVWALAVGPGSIALGFLLSEALKQNYYRIGSKWRLRLLDLSFD